MSRAFLSFLFLAMIHLPAEGLPLRYDTLTANGSDYQVADLNLKEVDLKLYWKRADGTAYQSLKALRQSLLANGKNFLMATNSGIYSRDFEPLGLHVERGKKLHSLNRSGASKGNFFMLPNGVFFLTDKGAEIMESAEYSSAARNPLEAAQSGPLLLRRGKVHSHFNEDSLNKKLRSGVGVTVDGHVIFAVSSEAVTFYEFAMLFKETLHCTDALYLDGTISVLTVRNSPEVQVVPFAGIWAATQR